jgi:SAM-dependent methyltransferase
VSGIARALERLHERRVHPRRAGVLAGMLRDRIPHGARVLDVGCGDGMVAEMILAGRPDLSIEGVDVLVRAAPRIPVRLFDGLRLPFGDASFDAVLLIDVLHHAADPPALLREAARVARSALLVKDHLRQGWLAGPTLRFMDWLGNARHGVARPGEYWPERRWREALDAAGLVTRRWDTDVPLYPWYASWIFGRSLHFVAVLEPPRRHIV